MADGLLNKASIILTPTGYKAGTLYNVAPVVEPYEDFDFARASVASRVNSSGLVEMVGRTIGSELVTNGDFATDSDWITGTGITIGGGAATFTSTPSGQSVLQSAVASSLPNGAFAKVTFEVLSRTEGSFGLYFSGTLVGSRSSVGVFTAYFTKGTETSFYIRALGTTSGTISNVSVKEIIDTNNIPRISYDSNGDNGHILLEPTTTNLYLNTDTLSTQNVSTTASDYSVSFYGTGTITFSGSYSGSLVGTGVNDRVTLTFTATSGTLTSTVSGSVTNAQIENLGYSTSYMPSLSTQGVRATETATGAGSADLINSTEGVLYAEIAALVDDLSFRTISISDGTTSNRCVLRYGGTTNYINVLIFSGGSSVFDNNYTLSDITDFSKIAVKWKANDFALWVDGVERKTDTSGSAPIGLSELQLSNYDSSSNNFYGKCKALAVFKEALSDSELTQLTT